MAELRISQSELARRIGVSQQTIARLVSGNTYGSKHLHRIARELLTTPAYLVGETDDPDENAPLPPRAYPTLHHVMMPVALPSENALSRMFEGMLETVDREVPQAELARELAQLLPTALLQLRGRLYEVPLVKEPFEAAVAEALPTADRGSRR